MIPFQEFSDTEIKEDISNANSDFTEDQRANRLFLKGDHWQSGEGWAGALPKEEPERSNAIEKINTLFTSQNVIKEITERHISAVLGKEPQWSVDLKRAVSDDETIPEGEQQVIDETKSALGSWWDTQEVHSTVEEWLKGLLEGQRSLLRVYIPSGLLGEGGAVGGGELEEQLNKIRVEAIAPDKGAVIENKDQSTHAGMISFTNDDDEEVFEISYLNDTGQTVIRNLTNETETTPLTLGGHLSIYEGERDLFLTKQIRQQNKLLNKAHTMMNNNLDSGFLERIFLNAQPPGRYEKDENGREVFVEGTYSTGPGTTFFANPPEVEDQEGNVQTLGSASVTFREPVPNTTFAEAKSEAYSSILEEAHQKHALIAGDASPSGESRIQALADFIMDAQKTKTEVDKAGQWLIETVMYLAFDLSGNESRVEEYKASFNCRIDPGNIPAEMRNAILQQVDEGLLSRNTAMAMLGVDDIDAELAKIDSAAAQALEILQQLRDANIVSKTLSQKMVGIVIADKQFISEALEESDLNAINDEIAAQADQNTQEQDLFNGLGV